MCDQCELYWAAGFWDGEGSAYPLGLSRGYPYVQLEIRQTELEPLERWLAVIQEGRIRGPYEHKHVSHDRWRPFWKWAAGGRTALRVIGLLEEYVSPPKRQQFSEAKARVLSNERQLTLPQ